MLWYVFKWFFIGRLKKFLSFITTLWTFIRPSSSSNDKTKSLLIVLYYLYLELIKSFVSVILNFGTRFAAVPAARILFLEHVNWRLISQLIKGITGVLQKLLRYFSGTIISTSFVSLFPVSRIICCLKLVHFYSIAINFLMSLSNHYHILLNYT